MNEIRLGKLFKRYAAPIFVVCALWAVALCLSIEIKTKPKASETFSLFMDLPYGSASSSKMESRIKEIAPSIKKCEVFCSSPSSSEYSTYYSTKGAEADLLVLSSSYLEKKSMDDFASLGSISKEGYSRDGVVYGLECNKSGGDYFSFPEGTYYCFLRKSSCHISSISLSDGDDLAITIMREFFYAV